MSSNVLLISDVIIKERSIVHGNTDPKLIYPDIKVAQDMFILPIIGTALYLKLQAAIVANDWTGLANYKTLLDDYIIDPLVQFTMARLPMNSYQFTNKGVMRKQGDNTELPSMSDLVDVANKYRQDGEWYAKRLIKYLQANTSLFPEYNNPGNGIDTIYPDQDSFTMPIYLGGNDSCCDDTFGYRQKPYGG